MKTQREGWLGEAYVRIYAESERSRVAKLYDFNAFLPDHEPWGSWGLDALCFGPNSSFYLVDWIPLEIAFRRPHYASVAALEADLTRLQETTPEYEHFQKEIHFVTPIVFGGNPKEKPMMVDQVAHAELCRFWNQTYARLNRPPQGES